MSVKIIAEIGVNWATVSDAIQMIRSAKKCNCDYVKFQLFDKDTIADSPVREKLEPLILKEKTVNRLYNCAKKNHIGFILTPMYVEAVYIAAKYCDEYIKIRFKDHENEELINTALDTGKTLLVSVPKLPLEPHKMYSPRYRWMYNLPYYPPRIEDLNLEVATACHGFSSHYPHTICDLAFAINRSHKESFIEKHVMFSHKYYREKYGNALEVMPIRKLFHPIDENVSIRFEELKAFIEQLKMIERIERIRL